MTNWKVSIKQRSYRVALYIIFCYNVFSDGANWLAVGVYFFAINP